ncbi:MAG: formylglycine-generating enzyme family protein [Planctomycetaceae bacterium]
MFTLGSCRRVTQWLAAVSTLLSGAALIAEDAKAPKDFKPYTQELSGTDISFEMVPIAGGEFAMGSPDDAEGHQPDEGPQHPVKISPFWMGKCEVTWEEYDIWSFNLDIQRRKLTKAKATELDAVADAVTRPTKPYVDMTFGMGHDGYPAISMTQLAAKMYCRWLSEKTGHYYRLPTEAEWEYACRAGTTTAYSFGDDPELLDEYGWNEDNSDFQYQPVGQKKPNPWGLHDMHGNVAEWTLDAYDPGFYATFEGKTAVDPLNVPSIKNEYNRVVRGGSWDQSAEDLRSAARVASTPDWKQQDPQRPQSIWYLTDALHVGFRVVRPVVVPSEEIRMKLAMEPVPGEVTDEGLKEGFIDHEE